MIENISFKGLPPKTRYVAEKIIVGARQGLGGLRKLKNEESVNLVVDVRRKRFFTSTVENLLCKMLGIKRVEIPTTLNKATFTFEPFEKAAEIVGQNTNGNTFLHCKKGKHRSVLVAAITQIKAGKIKTKGDLIEFLDENEFFKPGSKNFLTNIFKLADEKTKRRNFDKLKEHFTYYFMI